MNVEKTAGANPMGRLDIDGDPDAVRSRRKSIKCMKVLAAIIVDKRDRRRLFH